ncbi:hypothetical protein [Methylophaga sp.]|uniref:hypothetical protein n=1 Tax=Methylophaga sp. TaxID=2024840 RepID=UPI003A8E45CF
MPEKTYHSCSQASFWQGCTKSTVFTKAALGNMAGFNSLPLIMGRRCITGSPSGGIAETQEMLDFCGKTGILPECEMIAIAEINEAFERMERGEVHYRFVIDMATLSDA